MSCSGRTTERTASLQVYFDTRVIISIFAYKGISTTISHIIHFRHKRIPPSVFCFVTLQAVPSDRQLSRLASRLCSEWESVLLDPGLSTGALYRCRADHPLSLHGQVLAGLIQWRQSQGRSATVHRLLQRLQSTDVHPSTLDEVFQ
uniref:Death domain-containing protein n=1 Tax=Hucho hucho TaxID=62062 RepID=A0A4W5JVB2_9TELE